MVGYVKPPAASPMPGAWPLPPDSQHPSTTREPHCMDSSRSRYSPRLRGKIFARSAVGFRDQFALLEAPHPITSACRQLGGSARGRFLASKIANEAIDRRPSTNTRDDHQLWGNVGSVPSPLQDQFDTSSHLLLVPDICVTPETRVVGSGYHNFWVAIEVAARWHLPGKHGGDVTDFSEPQCLHSPYPAKLGEHFSHPQIQELLC